MKANDGAIDVDGDFGEVLCWERGVGGKGVSMALEHEERRKRGAAR